MKKTSSIFKFTYLALKDDPILTEFFVFDACGLSFPWSQSGGLSIPGLNLPGLSIPGLSFPGISFPVTVLYVVCTSYVKFVRLRTCGLVSSLLETLRELLFVNSEFSNPLPDPPLLLPLHRQPLLPPRRPERRPRPQQCFLLRQRLIRQLRSEQAVEEGQQVRAVPAARLLWCLSEDFAR